MSTITNQLIIENTVDKVFEQAISTSNGTTWLTVSNAYSHDKVIKHMSSSLLNGTCGIALFLQHYWKFSGNTDSLNLCISASKWLISEHNKRDQFRHSYYYGTLGSAELFLRLYKSTDQNEFLKQAKLMICDCFEDYKLYNPKICGLSYGSSSILLPALQYLSIQEDDYLIEMCISLIKFTISKLKMDVNNRLFWYRNTSENNTFHECLNSNAGIMFALFQATRTFKNDNLHNLIQRISSNEYDNKFNLATHSLFQSSNDSQNVILNFLKPTNKKFNKTQKKLIFELLLLYCILQIDKKKKKKCKAIQSTIKLYTNQIINLLSRNLKSANFHYSNGCGDLITFLGIMSKNGVIWCDEKIKIFRLLINDQYGKRHQFNSAFVSAPGIQDLSLFSGDTGISSTLLHLIEETRPDMLFSPFIDVESKIEIDESTLENPNYVSTKILYPHSLDYINRNYQPKHKKVTFSKFSPDKFLNYARTIAIKHSDDKFKKLLCVESSIHQHIGSNKKSDYSIDNKTIYNIKRFIRILFRFSKRYKSNPHFKLISVPHNQGSDIFEHKHYAYSIFEYQDAIELQPLSYAIMYNAHEWISLCDLESKTSITLNINLLELKEEGSNLIKSQISELSKVGLINIQ